MNLIKRHPTLFFGLAVTIVFLFLTLFRVEFFDALGLKLYDAWMKLNRQADTIDRIAIIDIDDESIEKLGRWPWPRTRIAECIDKIASAGPAVIGLNIIYSEPEENAGLQEIARLEQIFLEANPAAGPAREKFLRSMQEARARLDRDTILAMSMKNTGNVTLPVFFKDDLIPGAGETQIDPVLAAQAITVTQPDAGILCPRASEATLPIPAFRQAAAGMGHINSAPDLDGTYRRERLFYQFNDLYIPSYYLVIAARYLKVMPADITADIGSSLAIKDMVIPLTAYSEMLINYSAGEDAFKHYSFFDVINDKIPLNIFKGKIVLLSLSAKGLANTLSTPVSPDTSFGDFSANVIWSVLNGQFIKEMPLAMVSELIAVLILGLFVALILPRLKAVIAGASFFGVLCLLIGGSAYLFLIQGIWVQLIYPLLLLVIGYIGVVTISYFMAETGKEKVEGESAQTNRMLGISFQSQGMLDMAFDKFRKVPVDSEMKDILYNLALDYERKRQFNKAAAVFGYIEDHDGKFKDVAEKKKKLNIASETMVFGGDFGGGGDNLAATASAGVRPTLGRYEILKQLGKGAMGTVYLGQDPRINRTTAIKTVKFSEDFDEEEAKQMKAKFFREAESAGTLSHPNIVTIYDAGEEHDLAYIAMEYLEGEDLDKYTKKKNLLPMRKVIQYIAEIADGLDYAHQKGIVHRDIKPANVMLLKGEKIKITDFGIARITASSQTKTGIIKGTPYYMSPEQITGKKVDGRSDIFSLGVMMFQLLTGEVPFKGSSPAELMHKILNEPHPDPQQINPKIVKPLVAIINKAMSKKTEARYQTAGQMAQHLKILGQKIDAAKTKKAQDGK
ncbi:MAG: serine/threonine-protein kinase [Thermodesulfobacteriota bacterium]